MASSAALSSASFFCLAASKSACLFAVAASGVDPGSESVLTAKEAGPANFKILAHGRAAIAPVRRGTNLDIAPPAAPPNRLDRNPPLDESFAASPPPRLPPPPPLPIFLIASNSLSSRIACSFAASSVN